MSDTPKILVSSCYIGTTGFNNHSRDFFRILSNKYPLKIRNFTVPQYWRGIVDEPFNEEPYITDLDKKLISTQTTFSDDKDLHDTEIYKNYPNKFKHDLNIILAEVNHHYFYQTYEGPKIAYLVWETTEYPKHFYNRIKEFDQIWVPSQWQKDCNIKQGIPESKIKVVPEAVNGKIFKPNSKATLPEYEDNRFKFIHFGRWDYRKSTKEIIENFLKEFDKNEPVDLIISIDNMFAKDGFETTEDRLKHYSLLDPRIKIKHFPTRDEYIKYLQKGHVFLSCARSEGWNLPLIEAMACGTPSIYSNCSAQLEFAQGKGLPVNIIGTQPAIRGEYSTYSQSELSGEFYIPDFNHLREVMRDAYVNYDKHKKNALKESIDLRKKFTWENVVDIADKEIQSFMSNPPKNTIEISFEYGVKLEVFGSNKEKYLVEFINADTNKVIHSSTIKNNMWTKCAHGYYIPWIIKVNGEIIHTFSLENKVVKVSLDSKSIGDTLAWTPQIIEFQRKYNCKVIASTFHNEWFENNPNYKDITFVKPDTSTPSYAQYKIGWFKTDGKWDKGIKNKNQPNTIPLIQTATDALGLPYNEINHGVDFTPGKRPIKGKYICIGPRATSGLKEWPHDRWKELAKKLHKKGYKIVNISYEGFIGTNIINKQKLNWKDTFNYLYHADLFIGLGSGLSWANWALNKHTLMVNNFIPHGYEFTHHLTKIENNTVCNNCWVNKNHTFDPGNWDWCPENEGTKKQHICQKSISLDQVYLESLNILESSKDKDFVWVTGGDEKYLSMVEVLAKSLLKCSKYKLIVYGFNCDSKINLPNVINKRIDFERKPIRYIDTEDLIDKDYSLYFAKYLTSLDSLQTEYKNFAWIDGDAFATKNIDESLKYLSNLKDYPLFMRYFNEDIVHWRKYKGIKLEGHYGSEISNILDITRNPNNVIVATGFYFYNKNSTSFFTKCLDLNKKLDFQNLQIFADDNAFSEERITNALLWKEDKKDHLPITWNNYYSSDKDIVTDSSILNKGFDIMFDISNAKPYFIHGPDPSVSPKNGETLDIMYQEYQTTKLMIVAHPDDELIFGGAELIKHGPEYKVICLTNKSNEIRSKEFKMVMEKLNVGSWEMLDYEDTLHPTQQLDLEVILMSKKWEKIVTHNPIGEYGHPQHKLVFDTVLNLTKDFYVFGKSQQKLDQNTLDTKNNLLTLYTSETPIIDQLLTNNGDWFKSNDPFTNYIEHEYIEKYDVNKSKDNYIKCYEK